ncbi:MAG: MFS transporter [Deltaproteobacteria bacterium]|nr:MFS transporter [Deltaproteobacteria bacterium]
MTSTSHGMSRTEISLPLYHPAFVLLNLAYFLVFSNVALFYLYPVALDEMGAGKHVIGWLMGVFSLAAVLSRPLMGVLAARRGEFFLMSGGMFVMLMASACYPFLQSVGISMLAVRVAHGLGFSGFVAGSFSAVASLFPDERRASAYSIVGASLMSAMALAPPAGESLIGRFGFGALFLCAFGLILLAWAAVTGAAGHAEKVERPRSGRRTPYGRLLGDASFLLLLVSTLIFGHCQSTLFNFLALAAERHDASAGRFFFAAFAVAIGVLLTMGRVIDRKGKRRFMRLFYPALALGILLLPSFMGRFGGWIPAVLFGLGMGFLFPAHNALAAGYGRRDEKPGVMALFTAVYDSGFISGAVVSGWIAAWLGLDGLFYATGGLALIGLVICLAVPLGEGE